MDDSENQFAVAVKQMDASLDCPSCRTKDAPWSKPEFFLMVDSTELPVHRLTEKDGVMVVAGVCGRCGFVRLHAADLLGLLDEARGVIDAQSDTP